MSPKKKGAPDDHATRNTHHTALLQSLLSDKLRALTAWEARWPEYEVDETLRVPIEQASEVLSELLTRLEENYPFFHPAYAGQMLKPPHAIATLAYFLAQQINPNNHALDGGPATAKMEQDIIAELATMFGYDAYLGHLTSSGTIANLEALWVARSLHPQQAIAFSSEAHYTHRRMCEVIGARAVEIMVDSEGRMDLYHLRVKLKTGEIGTLVMTAGTTGIGVVDPIDAALELQREFQFRIHVDAAYGGFFKLLADANDAAESLGERTASAFRAITHCDSIVVDPHKHALQPYGCGSVLFRDPSVGNFYQHDSPYTYFTSCQLHLGEISLECSRAGAAAAALWATLRCFPLQADAGLGAVLRKTRRAALAWAKLIEADARLRLVVPPDLDIVTFYAMPASHRVSEINALTERIFAGMMNDPAQPTYLAKINLDLPVLARHDELIWDAPMLTALRSVLMKPEHLDYVPRLHKRVLAAMSK